MSSGLRDARVLQAFMQGVQRAYMLGVEQRITGTSSDVDDIVSGDTKVPVPYVYAESLNDFSTTSSTYVDVTDLSVNVVMTGRPILALACTSAFYVSSTTAATGAMVLNFNGTDHQVWEHETAGNTYRTIYGLAAMRILTAPAGTYTLKAMAKTNAGTLRIDATSQLIAIYL